MSAQDNLSFLEKQVPLSEKSSLKSGPRLGLVAPAPPVPGAGVSLPCLNCNKSDRDPSFTSESVVVVDSVKSVSAYRKKAIYALRVNVERFIDTYGCDYVGFLTLTFPDRVTDNAEGMRRWGSLRKCVIRKFFSDYILLKERHKNGGWHYHLLVACAHDIRTGFDHDAVDARDYSSVSGYLRRLWKTLREALPLYGFGRHELKPIRTNSEAMGHYVSKYLSKSWEGSEASGNDDGRIRLVSYSHHFLRGNSSFSWISRGAARWRSSCARFASLFGVSEMSEMPVLFGSHWAYKMREMILDIDWLEGLIERIPKQPGRFWYLGNDLVLDSDRGELFWDVPKDDPVPEYVPASKKIILAALSRIFGVIEPEY